MEKQTTNHNNQNTTKGQKRSRTEYTIAQIAPSMGKERKRPRKT